MWLISLFKGFCLSSFTYCLGMYMDVFISKKSFHEMIKEIPELYKEATAKIQQNLLILSPLIYSIVDQTLDHSSSNI